MLHLSQADLIAFNKDVDRLIRDIQDVKEIRNILNPAAIVVKERARQLTPVANPRNRDNTIERQFAPKKLKSNVLYTYKTPKINGKKRAGKGYGRVSGKYGIGNLKYSIQIISEVKTKIKGPVAIVGNLLNRKKNIPNPNENKNNGWYAHMIYGSARAFGDKVTGAALRQTQGIVFALVQRGVEKRLQKIAKGKIK